MKSAKMEHYHHKSGRRFFHLNRYESDFLYKEIFEDKVYLKHGIELCEGNVVVDVGANIGLYALFINEFFPSTQLYLVEPSPTLCAIIAANVQSFCDRTTVIQAGISDQERSAEFTFYPGYSILSGFKADVTKDAEFIRGGIRNQLARLRLPQDKEEAFIKSLMQGKLDAPQKFEAKLTTLSSLIQDHGLSRIDILKIDAEGCELEALQGLAPEDWPKIRQMVMEVHDNDGREIHAIMELLRKNRFRVLTDQEENFRATGITNLYAFNMAT